MNDDIIDFAELLDEIYSEDPMFASGQYKTMTLEDINEVYTKEAADVIAGSKIMSTETNPAKQAEYLSKVQRSYCKMALYMMLQIKLFDNIKGGINNV